jgi:PAS domain S-box-containing protein
LGSQNQKSQKTRIKSATSFHYFKLFTVKRDTNPSTSLTDPRQVEDALRWNQSLLQLMSKGNTIHANTTVADRLGYTMDELLGQSVLLVHPPERRDEAGRIVGEMLSGTAEFCPVPVVTKTGVQIPVETRVSHGHWNGQPAIFGVTKDISKVRLSEGKYVYFYHTFEP